MVPAETSGLRPWKKKRFTMKNAVRKKMYSSKLEEGNTKAHIAIPILKRTFIIAIAYANL